MPYGLNYNNNYQVSYIEILWISLLNTRQNLKLTISRYKISLDFYLLQT